MMRMCLVIYGSLDIQTGGFLYDKFLVQHLRQKGHAVHVASLPWRRYAQHLPDNFSLTLKSMLAKNAYDLILQDELNHPSLFWLNRNLRRSHDKGAPLVSIVHQVFSCQPRPSLLNTLFKIVEKAYLASVDAFIFNSETTRNRVQRLVNFRGPSIVANPGGDRLGHLQDAGQLKTRARRSGPLRMVCVANLSPIKGVVPLIETLATLPPEIWQLTVVGSLNMNPGYVRKVRRLIAAKNIGRQVLLSGPAAGSELKDILSGSQLFVMPFADEGFGIANLEALACGLPVLASASGAAKEYIRHGHNGFLFASGENQSVAEIISELHNDRDHLLQMSERALQTALERPGWSETMESIEHFLLDRVKPQKN